VKDRQLTRVEIRAENEVVF